MNKDEILERLAKSSNLKDDLLEVIIFLRNDTLSNNTELYKEIKNLYNDELFEIVSDLNKDFERLDNLKEKIKGLKKEINL